MTKLINHVNMIEGHINDVIDEPVSSREIFCKKLHEVTEPSEEYCRNCPYFNGLAGGYGHECIWEDVYQPDELIDKVIHYEDRYNELLRVSQLIDNNYIKRN